MGTDLGRQHRFLFLQGPHGPFFDRLAGGLRAAGAEVWRAAFNRGDEVFWSDPTHLIPMTSAASDWPARCAAILAEKGITDIALYGDTRPCHAAAISVAQAAGVTVHIFEEGYLRPYWITYERDGANGHSRLMRMSVAEMRERLAGETAPPVEAPAHWGDMREHIFYGALYHWFVMTMNGRYPGYTPHRGLPVRREFALYLQRLGLLPVHVLERFAATRAIRAGGFPYHLVLLQLAHDASFRHHGPFESMEAFLEFCLQSFARGAPAHHHLVFKAHPLEDGRSPQRGAIARIASTHGLQGRVHYVRGGKLALLLDSARSAVTVNSTAGQQALWRGLPLRALGAAIYAKPELVSDQPLAAFFANPNPPDSTAYAVFRRFLLETSQVPGGYYSRRGRAQLMRRIVDMVLAPADPYTARARPADAPTQHLRLAH